MKHLYICATLIGSFFMCNVSYADDYFNEWCDAFTAQGLVSLAANRIYGDISGLGNDGYAARSKWVKDDHNLAALRFKVLTGQDFLFYEHQQAGWIAVS